MKKRKLLKYINRMAEQQRYFAKNSISYRLEYKNRQGCLTRGPLKVLMRPSDYFQFSDYNEGYEEEFREIVKRHLGRKLINKRRFQEKTFFFR